MLHFSCREISTFAGKKTSGIWWLKKKKQNQATKQKYPREVQLITQRSHLHSARSVPSHVSPRSDIINTAMTCAEYRMEKTKVLEAAGNSEVGCVPAGSTLPPGAHHHQLLSERHTAPAARESPSPHTVTLGWTKQKWRGCSRLVLFSHTSCRNRCLWAGFLMQGRSFVSLQVTPVAGGSMHTPVQSFLLTEITDPG